MASPVPHDPRQPQHGARLLARADRPASGPATLIVRGGKVERVEQGHTPPPAGATLIDLKSMTVLPGLIDSHVHLSSDRAGTEAALASFTDIYWIVGGRPKAGGLAGLEPFFPRIARAYLIGEAAYEFAAQLGADVDHMQCGTLDRAIEAAASDARRSRGSEPVVLLSPACASYDQFANFEARGKSFRDLVMRLPGVSPVQPTQGRAA